MEDRRSVRLTGDEMDEFLAEGGTGVVSFAGDGDGAPYSLPVSYGYDAETGAFYFRLAVGPDSGKTEVIDRGPVSFVTHERTDDGWRSVVVTGPLEEVTEAAIDSDVVAAIRRVHIPLVDVFDRHPRELTFGFFRLQPDDVDGRKEARSV